MTEETWGELSRPLPDWFQNAKFGIFIHWGAYSVPAFGEPIGALGTIPDDEWFAHNPYAEWYFNTVRIEGSPAQKFHQENYGDAPYDDFLDQWGAEEFDPASWAQLFKRAGAEYVLPTTKHHDGITLWEAPGTGTRNTVHRGPKRDLIGEIAEAVRAEGMRFGVYYSGGLDWSITDFEPHETGWHVHNVRPKDAAYHFYALAHLKDLIAKYQPDVLWNDIEWPDAGKHHGPGSLFEAFQEYYAANPDGVVNDRWGDTHYDYATTEYSALSENEQKEYWENNRGLGYSFGYNRMESEAEILDSMQLAKHWVGVVAKGGRLLLNVGPMPNGVIPELQVASLEGFGDWKRGEIADAASVTTRSPEEPPSDAPWRRDWWTPSERIVFVDEPGAHTVAGAGLDGSRVRVLSGDVSVRTEGEDLVLDVAAVQGGPAAVAIARS